MRALAVICLIAGCSDSGLTLDINPASSDVASVEVFLPKDVEGNHMGLPPMTTQKTNGTVYAVVDHVTADVSGGRARILLQPGSITSVPALLVLGYNASHEAVRYAIVTDPKGPIQLPHSKGNTLVVDLDPIAEVAVAGAMTGSASAGAQLARWSHTTLDDPNGDCIAVLHDNGRGGLDGDFWGPPDDLDCDAANPECDDNWYLKVSTMTPTNPVCARNDKSPDTMDACRIGNSVACTDNVGDCQPRTEPPVCVPAAVCMRCNDQIDPSCFQDGLTDDLTPHVECDLTVGQLNGSGSPFTLCTNANATPIPLDLGPQIASGYAIVSAEFDAPPAFTGGSSSLALAGGTSTNLHVATITGARGLTFTAENGATPGIDPALPDTPAVMVIGVHSGGTRLLVLPFLAHYVNDCTQTPSCKLVLGIQTNDQPFNDPIWHCAGT